MRKFAIHLLLLAGCTAQLLMAQQSAQTDLPPNFIRGDDDDQVQIVPRQEATAAISLPKKNHGGAAMTAIQQVPIFWGKGWAENEARSRQAALADALTGDVASSSELQGRAIKTLRAAPSVNDFSDLSATVVNDLAIQRKLVDLLQTKAIPAPGPHVVYVVYLAPGVSSSIGASKAGTDYLAYHNVVNVEAGKVRYVVVPYNQNAALQRTAAARACNDTAVNPDVINGLF
ncbi:MAG TPA: hypothetical protein VFA71_04520 [Terriglobales bacterium]|nr:hypothetical protein [Terriglobales bacterium]